jgi:hypothetical protein
MITAAQIKKYNSKSVPELLKLAEKVFNKFIRERDSEDGWFRCISCQVPKKTEQMNAGHYMSAGHNGSVRFDEDNCWGQCIACNCHLHGNLIRYRENLIRKIGEDSVKRLESISRITKKWDRLELIEIICRYKEKRQC